MVRRNNKNTLSGLSVDSIVLQVKVLIEQREKNATGGGGGGSVGLGGGRGKSAGVQSDRKAAKVSFTLTRCTESIFKA